MARLQTRFKRLQAGYGKPARTLVSNNAHLWDRRGWMPSMKSLINSLGPGIFYDQNSAHSKESKQTIYQHSHASAYVMVRLYLAWTWNILRPEFCPFERIETNNLSAFSCKCLRHGKTLPCMDLEYSTTRILPIRKNRNKQSISILMQVLTSW